MAAGGCEATYRSMLSFAFWMMRPSWHSFSVSFLINAMFQNPMYPSTYLSTVSLTGSCALVMDEREVRASLSMMPTTAHERLM
ncbi:hypothetical protein [Bacteroides thetaiotaomicron]|uniref:hypothetical protein n=1 Tax=Bacteroides thetaiotaomicron TaxID=818 RepID=UPI0022DF0BD6|nr:hypothetical protein [Bacteroides thetaiotaomicron]